MALLGIIKDPPNFSDPTVRASEQSKFDLAYAEAEKNGTLVDYTWDDGTTSKLPPSNPLVIRRQKEEKEKELNLSKKVIPTKIDTVTGKGVPGGFDAASVKLPEVESAKITSTISSIESTKASLLSSVPPIPSLPNISLPAVPSLGGLTGGIGGAISGVTGGLSKGVITATKKLDTLKAKYTNKLKILSKVPDFTKKYKLPIPPRLPTIPDFKSLGIPTLPAIPKLPSIPTLPTLPNIGLPSLPSLPNVSLPSIPNIPTLPKLPSIGR